MPLTLDSQNLTPLTYYLKISHLIPIENQKLFLMLMVIFLSGSLTDTDHTYLCMSAEILLARNG